jgi:uncharacterized protein YcbK (DUF882 family)
VITLDELNPRKHPLTADQQANLELLHNAINKIRAAYGKPMIVTSGVRTVEEQMRINPKAPKSKHLLGLAVDIYDPDGKLNDWCKNNEKALIDAGLWCESRQGPWQHFQAAPPKSGRRWFQP